MINGQCRTLNDKKKDLTVDFTTKNNDGRRSGIDRRYFSYSDHIPERRMGSDRRSGKDRRCVLEQIDVMERRAEFA